MARFLTARQNNEKQQARQSRNAFRPQKSADDTVRSRVSESFIDHEDHPASGTVRYDLVSERTADIMPLLRAGRNDFLPERTASPLPSGRGTAYPFIAGWTADIAVPLRVCSDDFIAEPPAGPCMAIRIRRNSFVTELPGRITLSAIAACDLFVAKWPRHTLRAMSPASTGQGQDHKKKDKFLFHRNHHGAVIYTGQNL